MMMLRFLTAAVLAVALASCDDGFALPGPDTTRALGVDVSALQATYDAEFSAAIRAGGVNIAAGSFPRTLAALEASDASGPVGAFHTLLEGMIHLQTGALGQAALIAPDVTAAAPVLNTDGVAKRNVVLAQNFAAMVAARQAADTLAGLTRDSAEQHAQRVRVANQVEAQTAPITRRLCRAGTVDQGAGYVAAVQASALVSVDRALARACIPFVTNAQACAPFLESRAQLVQARDILAGFASGLPASSQISQIRRQIDRDLAQSTNGAALPPPASPCT